MLVTWRYCTLLRDTYLGLSYPSKMLKDRDVGVYYMTWKHLGVVSSVVYFIKVGWAFGFWKQLLQGLCILARFERRDRFSFCQYELSNIKKPTEL
jgi:hypothetical protein